MPHEIPIVQPLVDNRQVQVRVDGAGEEGINPAFITVTLDNSPYHFSTNHFDNNRGNLADLNPHWYTTDQNTLDRIAGNQLTQNILQGIVLEIMNQLGFIQGEIHFELRPPIQDEHVELMGDGQEGGAGNEPIMDLI